MDTSFETTTDSVSQSALVPTLVVPRARCVIGDELRSALGLLSEAFGQPFAVVDVESGDLVHSDYGSLGCDFYEKVELLAEVDRQGTAEIVEVVSPLVMLAIPFSGLGFRNNLVAVGVFVDGQVSSEQEMAAAARAFGVDARRAQRWAVDQPIWSLAALQQLARTVVENLRLRSEVSRLSAEVADATAHVDDVYAELDLLHRLTGQLSLSESEAELWRNSLQWLSGTIPAQCLTIVIRGEDDAETDDAETDIEDTDSWTVLTHGECPTDRSELCELIRRFGSKSLGQPLLLNRAETVLPTWHVPTIRELVCVPIDGKHRPRGWLLALNHVGGQEAKFHEFGSVEIQLLRSVGTILGIHHSNLGLYRDQAQLLSSSVQALTSAIDAKDRYTSGHSNRVANFSVALAEHLGLSEAERETLYLAGLLHDIGKIGIDDSVLNKAGELTESEFEQIKLHPQLGYEILKGVRQLDKVLPIVLHHHEAWDGSGYPLGLLDTNIPKMARIMAVADSFDAMTSDRPYRKGMSDEKVSAVLRAGAGKQWDAEVIDAFFAVRDEFRRIARESSGPATPLGDDRLS